MIARPCLLTSFSQQRRPAQGHQQQDDVEATATTASFTAANESQTLFSWGAGGGYDLQTQERKRKKKNLID